jgi:Kef-type K+ transport system membrane component KefB
VALLALGVILNLPSNASYEAIAISALIGAAKLSVLLAMILGFNRFLKKLAEKRTRLEESSEKLVEWFGSEALFGIVIIFVLVFGSVSELLGFHFVIGAFLGALLIDKKFFLESRYKDLERTLGGVTNGFLAPVFFAYLGLKFSFGAMDSWLFVALVLAVSVATKIFAGWLGGKLIRLPTADALGIGIILNGRGIMELVFASIAYERGFIGQGLFSTLVLMGAVTTMLTPILFGRWVIPRLALKKSKI